MKEFHAHRETNTPKNIAEQARFKDNSQNPSFFDNPLWDIHKTSQMLSVSEKTLRDWVYKRQIPFKKVGNLVRFDPSAIYRWIEERNNHGD